MSQKINYREHGDGPVLMLLHGYGGSVSQWQMIAEKLQHSYRVVVPNLSHLCVSTDKILFTVQVELLADFVRTHFPNQKISLGGLSYGGALAWALAVQHPELVEKLVLINPMVPNPVNSFLLPELRYFMVLPMNVKAVYFLCSTPIGKSFLKKAAHIFRDERAEGAIAIENLKGRKLMFVAHLITHFAWILRTAQWKRWQEHLATRPVNCLMIYDRKDILFSGECYHQFATQLNAQVVELTGAGHIAIKTQPEVIAGHIENFLKQTLSKIA